MADLNENVVEAGLDEVKKQVENYTDDEVKERESIYDLAMELVKSYGLDWTFRSINHVVNREEITFNQLRGCVFKRGEEIVFDCLRATLYLIEAGLVGSKQIAESNKEALEEKAYEIVEDWREKFGFVGTLHILLINVMEKKHFFMGGQDLRVLEFMSYKNMQADLAKANLAMDIEMKLNQSRAVQ